ncbi:hypothetical protein C8C83_2821 [Flavobacterium sp. 90]|uniref:hypothetical protein n=1 Tax=unclassified Flavobacterium TaxID=196869 RepID=UPI000EB4DC09|nr:MULTISPECIES: hypothetical protein [unclassified Flavobacterium]RKR11123.1 hypothetical protein C8C82_3129 [Flavobacterium sp. 81]TCK54906.1 hypothetical protein C8C83_2821 [Flavobacterium sp. 90]
MTTNLDHKDPFKEFLRILVILLISFSFGCALLCCSSKKTIPTRTIERIIEHKTDSVKTTEINRAILDSLIVKVAKVKTAKPECDSITQATLDQVLRQLNSYKKSGSNEASVRYDEALKQIVVLLKQAETKSQITSVNKEDKEKEKEIEPIVIREKYIPKWVKILAFIGGLAIVFLAWRIGRIFI